MWVRQVARQKQPAATRGRRPGAFHTSRRATTATRAAHCFPRCPLPGPARPMAPRHHNPMPFLPPRWRTFHPPPGTSTRAHGEATPFPPTWRPLIGPGGEKATPRATVKQKQPKIPRRPSPLPLRLVASLPACPPRLAPRSLAEDPEAVTCDMAPSHRS